MIRLIVREVIRCGLMLILQQSTIFIFRSHLHSFYQTFRSYTTQNASDKLFADAEREESGEADSQNRQKLDALVQQHENWTGEERIQDAVLRMLVDKYKPLRESSILTAEEKLKKSPPQVRTASLTDTVDSSHHEHTSTISVPPHPRPRPGFWAKEPLLPSDPTHKPWETTFKPPSDGTVSNVKVGRIPHVSASSSYGSLDGLAQGRFDERSMKKEKEKKKKTLQVERLGQALESTLDYRLGIKIGEQKHLVQTPNPVSLKGWNSIIEEKIEVGAVRYWYASIDSTLSRVGMVCRKRDCQGRSRM